MKFRFALALIMLMVISSALFAQTDDPESPILQMLALIPNNAIARSSTIGFSDFRAAEMARPAGAGIENWQAFEALHAEKDARATLWLNSLPMTGAANFANYLLRAAPDLPVVMGFDIFDIDRAITFGEPPLFADILMGDFDETAIDTALTSQGFVRSELKGLPLWCSETGCDDGYRVNVLERNIANLFGGDIGLKQPTVLADNILYSTRDELLINQIAETYLDEAESLADDAFYRTAANALTALPDSFLRQAYFVSPLLISGFDPIAILGEQATAEVVEAQIKAMEAYAAMLPPYQLLAIGDAADVDSQFATVILVYNREEDAQTALEVIPNRIADYTSLATRQTFVEMIEDRKATLLAPVLIADEATSKFAAVFTFEYPTPPDTPDDFNMFVQPGLMYRLLIDMVFRRDTAWLATSVSP